MTFFKYSKRKNRHSFAITKYYFTLGQTSPFFTKIVSENLDLDCIQVVMNHKKINLYFKKMK